MTIDYITRLVLIAHSMPLLFARQDGGHTKGYPFTFADVPVCPLKVPRKRSIMRIFTHSIAGRSESKESAKRVAIPPRGHASHGIEPPARWRCIMLP